MRKFLLFVVLFVAGYAGLTQYRQLSPAGGRVTGVESAENAALARAIESRASGVQLQGQGKVIKVLPDDNNGSRHQRFLLELPSGQTLLIAHNIDLSPGIPSLKKGDTEETRWLSTVNTSGTPKAVSSTGPITTPADATLPDG